MTNSERNGCAAAVVAGLLSMILAGCSSGGGGSSAPAPEPPPPIIQWPTEPQATLTQAQSQALSAATNQLNNGDAAAAMNGLMALKGDVGNNAQVDQTLGKAIAVQNGLSVAEFTRRLAPDQTTVTVTNAEGVEETIQRTPSVVQTLRSMIQFDNSGQFDGKLVDADSALKYMTSGNVDISSLSESEQKELALVATVQSLRIVAKTLNGGAISDPSQVSTLVNANYNASLQNNLETSAKILSQTSSAVDQLFVSNGTGNDATTVTTVTKGLSDAAKDGDIGADELSSLLVSFAPLVTN